MSNKSLGLISLTVMGIIAMEMVLRVVYEINYNHRQAWVPASEVTVVQPKV